MKRSLFVRVVLLSVGSMATASVTIDNFDFGVVDIDQKTTDLVSNQSGIAGVIGGDRSLRTAFTNSPSAVDVSLDVTDAGSGAFISSVPADLNPHVPTVTLSYGSYALPGTDLNANFSGEIDLRLDVVFADQGGSLTVEIDANNLTYVSSPTAVPATPPPTALFIPFTDFPSLVTDGLGDIDGIKYTFTGPAAWDITLDSLTSTDRIPEPATMSLLGLGLLALVRRRKRK